ncbi:outer membrane autotransporter barrel domain protein, partial [Yersinia pestis PY-12]
MGGLVHGG